MSDFQQLMDTYKYQHQNSLNQLLHKIGIPIILFSVFMVLSWVNLDFGTVWKISFGWLVLFATAIYYFRLGIVKLAAATSVMLLVLLVIALLVAGPTPTQTTSILAAALFVAGWILLLVGHLFEKSKPAFMQSLGQVLVAPLFLVNELVALTGYHLVEHTSQSDDQPPH